MPTCMVSKLFQTFHRASVQNISKIFEQMIGTSFAFMHAPAMFTSIWSKDSCCWFTISDKSWNIWLTVETSSWTCAENRRHMYVYTIWRGAHNFDILLLAVWDLDSGTGWLSNLLHLLPPLLHDGLSKFEIIFIMPRKHLCLVSLLASQQSFLFILAIFSEGTERVIEAPMQNEK